PARVAGPRRVERLQRPPIPREIRAARPDCSSLRLHRQGIYAQRPFLSLFRLRASGFRFPEPEVGSPKPGGITMRATGLLLPLLLCLGGSASAQDWELYTNNDDGFKLDFPGLPEMTQTTVKDGD